MTDCDDGGNPALPPLAFERIALSRKKIPFQVCNLFFLFPYVQENQLPLAASRVARWAASLTFFGCECLPLFEVL